MYQTLCSILNISVFIYSLILKIKSITICHTNIFTKKPKNRKNNSNKGTYSSRFSQNGNRLVHSVIRNTPNFFKRTHTCFFKCCPQASQFAKRVRPEFSSYPNHSRHSHHDIFQKYTFCEQLTLLLQFQCTFHT